MSRPTIVDSHCHLDFPDFEGQLDTIVQNALDAGVERMVSICTKKAGLDNVKAIVATYPEVFYAYGIHPMSAASHEPVTVEDLVAEAANPKMVGIGETGLDYHYTPDSADVQKSSLRVHIEAAQKTSLPLIIHSRDADDDMAAILREGYDKAPYSCVMHCFSSGPELAKAALEMGFYLSMSGIATFPKSQDVRDIFAAAPIDLILVETDSPYLAPKPYRGKRNEPAYSVHTAAVGAEVFGMSYDDFAAATTANFDRLFSKAKL